MTAYKTPVSVLVVIHTVAGEFLLIERAAHPGYWQSVTGSLEATDADLAWFEEPVTSDDPVGLRVVRDAAPAGMDVAAGEYVYSLDDARILLEAGAIRFKPIVLTALAAMIGAAVILFDPIFQGLAISLMMGEVAATLQGLPMSPRAASETVGSTLAD